MTVFVTGGAGFIGSALIRSLIENSQHHVVNIDKLSYASNLKALDSIASSERYVFEKTDICDLPKLHALFAKYRPTRLINLAAESHVDRSIDGPEIFIQSNIVGTFNLLEASRTYIEQSTESAKYFKFHHISTDEVYGDLEQGEPPFSETASFRPSSPYAASKASADHLVRAWGRTYNIPYVISNCSNNYGPWQCEEKLIPHFIMRALNREPLPVYGDGEQIRDWLHVSDHVAAILLMLDKPLADKHYNIGANNERTNRQVIELLCCYLSQLDKENGRENFKYQSLITQVEDRAGHDRRYAIDPSKLQNELNWKAKVEFESGLKQTVEWYYLQYYGSENSSHSLPSTSSQEV